MVKQLLRYSKTNSVLILETGELFFGKGYGYIGTAIGEICFNTSITGYQEILTDPSYANQIITFTFPHIGIVGTNKYDYESEKIFASGCIVNNALTDASNHRSEISFEAWLRKNKKICISGIDTRTLTKKIRVDGVSNALIHNSGNKKIDIKELKKKLHAFPKMESLDLASEIITDKLYFWNNNNNKKITETELKKYKDIPIIAVINFGIKKNILRLLQIIGFKVLIFPLFYDFKKILKMKPVGIFLSNGPGDPLATFKKIRVNLVQILNTNIPIFGICLGHQILSLAYGAKTIKMNHGHRGANHPIKNLKKQNVEITVQNHGFVVSKSNLPKEIVVSHISLFDKTIAGIKIKNKPFFSVQYHPESSPGPRDSRYLFEDFKRNIMSYAKKKRY